MCKIEGGEKKIMSIGEKRRKAENWVMGLKSGMIGEKMKGGRYNMKMWMIRATSTILLWTCMVQLTALGENWGPRVLKGWPSCFSQDSAMAEAFDYKTSYAPVLPPKSEFVDILLWKYVIVSI